RLRDADGTQGDGRAHAVLSRTGAGGADAGGAGVPARRRSSALPRSARPARPPGARSTKAAKTAPITAGQYFVLGMSVDSRNLTATAPAAGPKNDWRPPSMVMRTASPVLVQRSVSAPTWRKRKAASPPAIPQMPADSTKARSRYRTVSKPRNGTRARFCWMARHTRPNGERVMYHAARAHRNVTVATM